VSVDAEGVEVQLGSTPGGRSSPLGRLLRVDGGGTEAERPHLGELVGDLSIRGGRLLTAADHCQRDREASS
jgi:hypothetical protein